MTTSQATPLVGVIDVGSNSIRLVVFEDGARSPDYFFNEKTICRLGDGLSRTGHLNPEGRDRARDALLRFVMLARRMGVRELIGVGTAAMRQAMDALEFRDQIAEETGLEIRIASGAEEARLSAYGVLLGWPQAKGVIADLGGASLELARIDSHDVTGAVSTNAGHLRLVDPESRDARNALASLAAAAGGFAPVDGPLILIGGAWRALAKAQMSRTSYPMHVLQGFELEVDEAMELCDWALGAEASSLKRASRASSARAASVTGGAAALKTLIETLTPDCIAISAYGLREGLIYDRMNAQLRAEEPLLAAARAMEARSARAPGFGDELFEWIQPILADFSEDGRRLSHAACLLHDVNWRQHPDFRAAACFATVTRANLSGVGHKSRVFIGAALLHRYKANMIDRDVNASLELLPEDQRRSAEALGRALRLGAMLTGSARGMLGKTRLELADGELALFLEPGVATLAGERVERRLKALADCLGLTARLIA